jgi:hypothetical protein
LSISGYPREQAFLRKIRIGTTDAPSYDTPFQPLYDLPGAKDPVQQLIALLIFSAVPQSANVETPVLGCLPPILHQCSAQTAPQFSIANSPDVLQQ